MTVVPGKIIGGQSVAFLIAVNDEWGRVFVPATGRLGPLMRIQSIVGINPEAFDPPFDGTEEEAEAILAAARVPLVRTPEVESPDGMPDQDIVTR